MAQLLRRAKNTGLTALGTGSAQALEDGTSYMALTAFYPQTLESAGYEVAGLTEKHLLFSTDTGQLALRSTPDFSRALLLTVADGKKLEVLKRYGENASTSSADEHSQSASFGGGFLYNSPDQAGLNQVGAFGPGPNSLDGDGMPVADEHLTSRNLKPNTGRSFLFAVPTSWLSVGDVHRNILDSKAANRIRGTFGQAARSGPQAMTSEAYVIAWVREDIARELMLITDTNFPKSVGEAWDAVKNVSGDWVKADQAYWKKRRASMGLPTERDAARAALDRANDQVRSAQQVFDIARAEVTAVTAAAPEIRDGAAVQEREAARQLADAQRESMAATELAASAQAAFEERRRVLPPLLDAANTLAAEYHRVRPAADQLTRWHQLMATEEGRRSLQGREEPMEVT